MMAQKSVRQCRYRWPFIASATDVLVKMTVRRTTGRRVLWMRLPDKHTVQITAVGDKSGAEVDPQDLTAESRLRIEEAMIGLRLKADDFIRREKDKAKKKGGGHASNRDK